MKILSTILTGILLLLLSSAIGIDDKFAVVGNSLESFSLISNKGSIDLNDVAGKRIITFWKSSDASSRISNAMTAVALKEITNDISLISINLDKDKDLALNIAKVDGISSKDLYAVGSRYGKIEKAYDRQGIRSILIDSNGRILAVNPSTEYIKKF